MYKKMITLTLALIMVCMPFGGCKKNGELPQNENDSSDVDVNDSTSDTSESNSADTENVKDSTDTLSNEPIDSLSIKRGINVSSLEYDGFLKEMRMSLRDPYTKENFENIKNQGFDHVRLPVNFAANYSDGEVNAEFLKQVDDIINMILDLEMTVILDFHGWKEINYDVSSNKAQFYDIWEQVAEHYKDYPHELLFEILNEPHDEADGVDPLGIANLNMIQNEAIRIIRKTNPKRIIVAACPFNNYSKWLERLELPDVEEDPNIIVDVHTYTTIEFTHQGSELWMNPNASREPVRISQADYDGIDNVYRFCKSYMETTGRKIWLGEFGMVVAVPEEGTIAEFMTGNMENIDGIKLEPLALKEDITEYVSRVTKAMDELGIPCAWWEYDLEFGAYDLIKGEWRDFVMEGLMPQD